MGTDYFDPAPGKKDTGHAFHWIAWGAVILAFLSLALFTLSWWNAGLRQASPARLEQLSRQANDHWQSLKAQQASIDTQNKRLAEFDALYGADRTAWPQGKAAEYQQLSTAVRNLETAYNNSCGQYMALWADEWRSLPAPDDLPTRCELR